MNTLKILVATLILASSVSPAVAAPSPTVAYGCPAGTHPVWDPEQHRVVCV